MTIPSFIKNRERERALKAYEAVKEAIKEKEFKTYAKKLPVMVMTNGLPATLAFIQSKTKDGKNAYKKLLEILKQCLVQNGFVPVGNNFLKEVLALDSTSLRHATREVLALAQWIKRLADALIEDGGESRGS